MHAMSENGVSMGVGQVVQSYGSVSAPPMGL